MTTPDDPVVPIEIITEFDDRMQPTGPDGSQPLKPGEGLVECTIIHEFDDSASAPSPTKNGTPADQTVREPEDKS